MSEERLYGVVSGRVQGVGYRHFVWQRGQQLRLRGWVRNLPDGRVEVVAEGPRSSLDILEAYLRRGPASAKVDQCDLHLEPADGSLEPFDIRY